MDKADYYNTSVPTEILENRNAVINSRWKELSEFYLRYSDEIIKYLFYVNAGGVGTIIGFMGTSDEVRQLVLLRVALCFFSVGLILVGVLRTILVHQVKSLFDNWRKDSEKYWKNEIGYNELNDKDDKRAESDCCAFVVGYCSGIAFVVGLILGGISLFTY